uniref:Uncharacterized protein n=1 Tax=Glossina pallidipes TaxID=7398 RepID=A0A1A9ZA44_GLOPL
MYVHKQIRTKITLINIKNNNRQTNDHYKASYATKVVEEPYAAKDSFCMHLTGESGDGIEKAKELFTVNSVGINVSVLPYENYLTSLEKFKRFAAFSEKLAANNKFSWLRISRN